MLIFCSGSIDNTIDVNCLIITLTNSYAGGANGMTEFNNTVPITWCNEVG
ncbi:MAG: hypothetical protein IPO48_01695 [Saprospiraceae bacterium]|nr:hypothetical protein [Saprospiraceae bacterium]